MTDPSPDALDQLLHRWAESRAATDQRRDELSRQVMAAIADDVCQRVELPSRRQQSWETKLMVGGGSLLVLLMLAGSLLYVNRFTVPIVAVPPNANTGAVASPPPAFPPESLLATGLVDGKARLLAETNLLFEDHLRWIAEGRESLVVEVDDQVQHHSEFLLVRLVVARRDAAGTAWQPLWKADVMTRSEELVEVRPGELAGSSLALWAFAMPDGAVMIDMDLHVKEQSIDSTTSMVLQVGQPKQVECRRIDSVERCVFLTVLPLPRSERGGRI